MTFTIEALLESPTLGFGIETLSPLQRAKARIIDGLPLGELAARDDVRRMLGCDPALFEAVGMPVEVVDLCGIRTLKTITADAACIRMAMTVDVTGLRVGEVPRVYLLSQTIETARPGFDVLVGTMMARRALRALVIGEPTADSITLRHPTGQAIEIKVVPMSRAGTSLVGRWCAGIVVDEAPRLTSAEDGYVLSLEDCRTAVRGRLLPGAQGLYIGSPWAPEGFCYQAFTERHGKPGRDLVVMRADAPSLNPTYWTTQKVAEVRAASPRTYLMDVEAQFGATATTAYALADVEATGAARPGAFRSSDWILSCDPSKLLGHDRWGVTVQCWRYPVGDPISDSLRSPLGVPGIGRVASERRLVQGVVLCPDGVYRHSARFEDVNVLVRPDGSTVDYDPAQHVPCERRDVRPYLHVDHAVAFGAGTTLEEIGAVLAELVRTYRPTLAVADYGGDTGWLLTTLRALGIYAVHAFPWSETQRRAGFEWLGRLLADRRAEIPQEDVRRDLLRIESVLSPNGKVSYRARRGADGHADLASCLVGVAIAHNENLVPGSPFTPVNYRTEIQGG